MYNILSLPSAPVSHMLLPASNAETAAFLQQVGLSLPGIDEATSFMEILKSAVLLSKVLSGCSFGLD